jgi:hypothetical protein
MAYVHVFEYGNVVAPICTWNTAAAEMAEAGIKDYRVLFTQEFANIPAAQAWHRRLVAELAKGSEWKAVINRTKEVGDCGPLPSAAQVAKLARRAARAQKGR